MTRTTLSGAETRAVRAHAWLASHGGACQWQHVPWHYRQGIRAMLRRGLLYMTPGGVVAIPGVL